MGGETLTGERVYTFGTLRSGFRRLWVVAVFWWSLSFGHDW